MEKTDILRQSFKRSFGMTARAGNRATIYGPVYEAHDFCLAAMRRLLLGEHRRRQLAEVQSRQRMAELRIHIPGHCFAA
jgi:hypothetical protein